MTFLIRANLWVAFGMACLAAFLSLAFQVPIEWANLLLLFILVWQIFTLDRFIIHPEDQKQGGCNLNIVRFVRIHRKTFLYTLIASVLLVCILGFMKPGLLWSYFFIFLCGLFYLLPLPFLGKRVKAIPYFKVFYVPFVSTLSLMFFTQHFPHSTSQALLYFLIFVLIFLNTTLFDTKDSQNDAAAGIKTLATLLLRSKLIWSEFAISILLGLALVFFGSTPPFLAFGITFLIYGPAALVLLKKESTKYLFTVIDGMSVLVLVNYLILTKV